MKFYSLIFLLCALCSLSSCDRRYTQKTIPNYDIENSEIEQRRKANQQKSFQNLANVPDRSFDAPTLADFEALQEDFTHKNKTAEKERQLIKLDAEYTKAQAAHKGPFALELVDKIDGHLILADSLEFNRGEIILSTEHLAFLDRFAKGVSDKKTPIILIAPRQETVILDIIRRQRMKAVLDYLLHKDIAPDRLYFGFDDQVKGANLPSLARITDDEVKIFVY